GTAALPGCPDTERPALSPRSATRVCTAEELSEFRLASTADVRHDLWVAFVDVGQGDATWIRTPGTLGVDAKEILIDAGDCQLDKPFPGGDGVGECGIRYTGPSDGQVDGVGALIDFMSSAGWTPGSRIDYLVVTHPDKDHYGGAWRILQQYIVDAVVDPGVPSEQTTYLAMRRAVQAEGAQDLSPAIETGLDGSGALRTGFWGLEVEATLLSADANAPKENNASVVIMLQYRGVRLLLTGDAEKELDSALAAQHGPDLRAQVLKAGHHGGRDTNTSTLLDLVFPPGIATADRYAIISSGQRENLPADDTLERLLAHVGTYGLYRTDRGDSGKGRVEAPGDDHILMRVTPDGELTLCYAFPD
ncbi:MAG: MBL fold metallo-hydrolase, partial [Myxococcales bacterium]|nr:MBL fold metallo-hydrolase [Myxococcales bacterium]